jgi:hypothetical protein
MNFNLPFLISNFDQASCDWKKHLTRSGDLDAVGHFLFQISIFLVCKSGGVDEQALHRRANLGWKAQPLCCALREYNFVA